MIIDRIALILAVIGGLNWGLVGLFRFDLVAYIFGGQTATVSPGKPSASPKIRRQLSKSCPMTVRR